MKSPRLRPYIFFIALLAFGLFGAYLVSIGYYPVAFAGGQFITARQFHDTYGAASIYSETYLETYYPTSTPEDLDDKASLLQAAVLDQLIEEAIVSQELHKEVGSDFDVLVSEKVNKFDSSDNLRSAADQLFGLSYDDFKDRVLVPQAEREVMEGRLFLKGQTFDPWLSSVKKSKRVLIFSSRFGWDGNKVKVQ